MPDKTRPTPTTREAERAEAEAHAQPDRMPTPEEEEKAEENELDPEVAEHEREMLERGGEPEGRGPAALSSGSRELEEGVQAGDAEDLAYRILGADDHEALAAGFAEALQRADEHPEPRGIDEADSAQIERDLLGAQRKHRLRVPTGGAARWRRRSRRAPR